MSRLAGKTEEGEGGKKKREKGGGGKRRKEGEGEKARYVSAERGGEGRGAKRAGGGGYMFSGIRAKLKSRRAVVVGIRGGEGNEGIRSCDCTKFAVRTVASFRRDRNMHW